MDDSTPHAFLSSLRDDLLRRRVGFIALAVMLALACLQFLNNLVWYLLFPLLARVLSHSTSVMVDDRNLAFPTQQLVAAIAQFALAIIAVYYLNRWLVGRRHRHELRPDDEAAGQDERAITEPFNVALGALADEANQRQEKTSAEAEARKS